MSRTITLTDADATDYLEWMASRIAAPVIHQNDDLDREAATKALYAQREKAVRNLIGSVKFGRRIDAIKQIRTLLNVGLREAKDIEELETARDRYPQGY